MTATLIQQLLLAHAQYGGPTNVPEAALGANNEGPIHWPEPLTPPARAANFGVDESTLYPQATASSPARQRQQAPLSSSSAVDVRQQQQGCPAVLVLSALRRMVHWWFFWPVPATL